MIHCIPSHIDTCDLFLCLLSPEARVLLPREPRLLRPLPPRRLVPGANVSTIIFCDVSLRLSQSIDLNIRLARLISYKWNIIIVDPFLYKTYFRLCPRNHEGEFQIFSWITWFLSHHQEPWLTFSLRQKTWYLYHYASCQNQRNSMYYSIINFEVTF